MFLRHSLLSFFKIRILLMYLLSSIQSTYKSFLNRSLFISPSYTLTTSVVDDFVFFESLLYSLLLLFILAHKSLALFLLISLASFLALLVTLCKGLRALLGCTYATNGFVLVLLRSSLIRVFYLVDHHWRHVLLYDFCSTNKPFSLK